MRKVDRKALLASALALSVLALLPGLASASAAAPGPGRAATHPVHPELATSKPALTRPAIVVPGTWNEVPVFNPTNPTNPDNSLSGVACASAAYCVTVGSSYDVDSQTSSQVGAQWSGSSWNELNALTPAPSTTNSSLNGVSCVPQFCMAVGAIQDGSPYVTEAQVWNGSSWGEVSSPNPGGGAWGNSLIAVSCVSSTFCVAVDTYQPQFPSYQYLLMQWNGTTWSTVVTLSSHQKFYAVSCVLSGSGSSASPWCAAVGQDADLSPLSYVLGGGTWSQVNVPTGTFESGLNGVSCSAPQNCMAVGFQAYDPEYTPSQNDQFSQNLVEEWTNSGWSPLTVPNTNTVDGNQLQAVDCFGPTSCVAVGYTYTDAGADTTDQVLAWNGTSWAVQPTPTPTTQDGLNAVACVPNQQCAAVGYSGAQNQAISASVNLGGYYEVGADGGIYAFGAATFFGSTGGLTLNKPVVGMAVTPDGGGYWFVASDGGIFSYGDAPFYGSMGGQPINAPIVGMAETPDGGGYWLVGSDGGIYSFGDAQFYGSTGAITLNKPIVGMTPSVDGHGYWLVASDGGIFTYGDATFFGSTGGLTLNKPIVGMASTGDGQGYWLVGSDGGIFTFGDAPFYGSTGSLTLIAPVVGITATGDGHGYWLVASDGGIFTFGDAPFYGSMGGQPINAPIVGLAA